MDWKLFGGVYVVGYPRSETVVYRFENYEFDPADFRFFEAGQPVALEPKGLHVLLYLLEHRTRLVRKQELLDAVWGEANVTENALTRVVGLLRKALKEDSRVPRYIETVPTLGYRWIAPVVVDGIGPAEAESSGEPGIVSWRSGSVRQVVVDHGLDEADNPVREELGIRRVPPDTSSPGPVPATTSSPK